MVGIAPPTTSPIILIAYGTYHCPPPSCLSRQHEPFVKFIDLVYSMAKSPSLLDHIKYRYVFNHILHKYLMYSEKYNLREPSQESEDKKYSTIHLRKSSTIFTNNSYNIASHVEKASVFRLLEREENFWKNQEFSDSSKFYCKNIQFFWAVEEIKILEFRKTLENWRTCS